MLNAKYYVTPRDVLSQAIDNIKKERLARLKELNAANKLVEAQRLDQRTAYDLEMKPL
ncbi:hypothetical protein BGS_1255 [Beggiatoa sp. SS]|nr:hypothetical protein BGS_1255 [Beggiatoa sp. SS]